MKTTIIIVFIIIYIIIEIIYVYNKLNTQLLLFKKARQLAHSKHKKLLVIGDPCNGFWNKLFTTYSHGDICFDINGCANCIKYDINNNYLSDIDSNKYIIFESSTFCFSNHIEKLLKNVFRISGGNFFSCGSSQSIFFRIIGKYIYQINYKDNINYITNKYKPGQKYKYFDYNNKKWNIYNKSSFSN